MHHLMSAEQIAIVYTVAQAARKLCVHEKTVRRWIKTGVIRAERPGGRKLLIPAAEIDRLTGNEPDR